MGVGSSGWASAMDSRPEKVLASAFGCCGATDVPCVPPEAGSGDAILHKSLCMGGHARFRSKAATCATVLRKPPAAALMSGFLRGYVNILRSYRGGHDDVK
jgi:hypothetical protein